MEKRAREVEDAITANARAILALRDEKEAVRNELERCVATNFNFLVFFCCFACSWSYGHITLTSTTITPTQYPYPPKNRTQCRSRCERLEAKSTETGETLSYYEKIIAGNREEMMDLREKLAAAADYGESAGLGMRAAGQELEDLKRRNTDLFSENQLSGGGFFLLLFIISCVCACKLCF
jgi:septal ring factor EnvC (AmiA/AmiB activator)